MPDERKTVQFREVHIPIVTGGKLYLHSMPGRDERIALAWDAVRRLGIDTIVCLAPLDEIREKSPDYAAAIQADLVPCEIRRFPICDYRGPDDDEAFKRLAVETAEWLRDGKSVLVHCGAGIGRTGMFAMAALIALGLPVDEAGRVVTSARSGPERDQQHAALRRFAQSLALERQPGNAI